MKTVLPATARPVRARGLCRHIGAFLREIARFLHLGLAVAGLPFIGGCASLPGNGTARTNSGSYEFAQAGSGGPAVVFEAGAGESMSTWGSVFPRVAAEASAFAYSRRGEGRSSPALLGRDGASVVRELRELLAQRGVKPPYVLVGHSLGGLYVQLFAKMHPQEVAGVVLVDSTTAAHRERMRTEQPAAFRAMQAMATLGTLSPQGAEMRGLERTTVQWRAAGPFPHCPVVVLTATRAAPLGGASFTAFTAGLQSELTSQWPGAQQSRVDSGHYIQHDQPDAVVNAVHAVLEQVRRPKPVP